MSEPADQTIDDQDAPAMMPLSGRVRPNASENNRKKKTAGEQATTNTPNV
jgi:hypothetical protein